MRSGTFIDYSIRLGGVPMHWRTRIETFEAPTRFVDRATLRSLPLLAPRARIPGRSRRHRSALDRMTYALPFGFLGALAHRLFVRRVLERIFDYR